MANINCEACDEIRQTSPGLIINGLGDEECTSLQNDTGLNPSSGHTNCEDLNNLNDCLVGNMAAEVDAYEICDWKPFMKKFIPNVWTTLKGIICALCGIWTRINCIYNGLVNLIDTLAQTTGGKAFVSFYRDLGAGDSVPYWERVGDDFEPDPLEIYMDSHGASSGSQPADRDYVVMISNCTNYLGFEELHGFVTFYSSGEDDSTADKRASIRSHKAQHPVIFTSSADQTFANFSWTTSGAVLLRKGEHIKVGFYVTTAKKGNVQDSDNTRPRVRLHQFVLTWIPVNVSDPLDPTHILDC